jgi:predicted amidohydrolase YtcJ
MRYIVTAKIIYLSFNPKKTCGAIGIDGGIVRATGSFEEVVRKMGSEVKVKAYPDRVIMPGFVDAHMHLDDFGKYISIIDLRGVTSIEEMKAKISRAAKEDGWVLGHGWDQDLFSEGRWPTRNDLDKVQDFRPVFLSRVDLHSAVMNSAAIKEMGLEEKFAGDSDLVRDSTESITGVVKERVFGYADDWIKFHMPDEEWKEMLRKAETEANKVGVTSVGFMSCSIRQYTILSQLKRKSGLSLRIHAYISSDEFQNLDYSGGDEFLRISGVKSFSDGSLGSRTALLSFPYSDDPGNYGEIRESNHSIYKSGKLAESRRMDIGTHAIGDKALDNVLSVYEKLCKGHRIEHASLVRNDQLERIRKCKAVLVVQPHFTITDFWTLKRVGKEKAGIAYPFNTILKNEIPLAFSTDCPVENLNPWETVYAAVTRGSYESVPLGLVSGEERISTEQALQAYTEGSADALKDPKIGSLYDGNFADFIAVDRDPLEVEDNELRFIKVVGTWVGGKPVWQP